MPRFEVLYYATCDLACDSAEEAAAIVRARLSGPDGVQTPVRQLAVWREDGDIAASPLDAAARAHLEDFFTEVHRCAREAEDRFRGDIEAILLALPTEDAVHSKTDGTRKHSRTE